MCAPGGTEADPADILSLVSAQAARGLSPQRPTSGLHGRDDLPSVRLERLLLALGHQIDVPLVDAGRLQPAELLDVGLGGTEDAEALAGLVRDLLAVPRADTAVLRVVVRLALHSRHVLRERRRHIGPI